MLHHRGVSVITQQKSCADVAPRGKYSMACSCDSLEHKTHLVQEGPSSFTIGWKPSSVISAVAILVPASICPSSFGMVAPFFICQRPPSVFKSYHQVLFWKACVNAVGNLCLFICISLTSECYKAFFLIWAYCTPVPVSNCLRAREEWLNLILIPISSQQITNNQGESIKHTLAILVPGNALFFFVCQHL